MPYSPRNIRIACNHAGLTHYGGVYFSHEFLRALHLRHFLATHLTYPRRNSRYHLSQMVLALMYPIVLGLDRLETASFLRSNGTFQFLTGLPSFPDPQTLRRFLHLAPDAFWQQVHRVFGEQEDAAVGYNPRYRGKKSYDPLLCMEANSSYLWDAELRPGNAGTWDGSIEVLDTSFANVPPEIRELRVRADAGFGFNPVFVALEARRAQYAVVARLTQAFKRLLPGISYEPVNRKWEMAEFEHRPHGWPQARRFVVARRFIQQEEAETTLFSMGRYIYRAWVTNLPLTPAGIWHFYDGRAGMEPRIRELREDFALHKIPTASFAANALYLEIVRLAYNLVTAFQWSCLDESWQSLTLQKLRHKLFLIPGELTRPQNRPVLRLRESPLLQDLSDDILRKIQQLKPIQV